MRKHAKSHSLGRRLAGLLLTGISRFTLFIGDFFLRNPLLTAGSVAFAVTLGFVSANALWYQPQAHSGVFFETRTGWDFKATPRSALPKVAALAEKPSVSEEARQAQANSSTEPDKNISIASLTETLSTDTLPALAANADVEIALIQQKLAALGMYNGNVDGLTGPQTRQAIEYWKQLQVKAGVEPVVSQVPVKTESTNIIVAVPSQRPKAESAKLNISDRLTPINTAKTPQRVPDQANEKPYQPKRSVPSLPDNKQASASASLNTQVTSQDIIRVQAGLKAFGNDGIVVDGVSRGATVSAIKEFRKLFGLPINGNIDADLMAKMREIGLIS